MAVPVVNVVPLDSVSGDPTNARKHPERNAAAVTASLKRFGPGRSIVLDRHDTVRAGNQTIESARDAGITEVVVVEPEPHQLVAVKRADWDEAQATGYAIADNRAAEHAEWDDSILTEQLRAIETAGIDLEAVGFTGDELDALIESLATPDNSGLADAIGGLPDGDKSPFQQMTFTVSDAQAETIKEAMDAAKDAGEFGDTGNENSNGNALARIAEAYIGGG